MDPYWRKNLRGVKNHTDLFNGAHMNKKIQSLTFTLKIINFFIPLDNCYGVDLNRNFDYHWMSM